MVGSRRSTLRHAGLLERGLAWFVDSIVSFVLVFAITLPVLILFAPAGASVDAAQGIGGLLGIALTATYYIGSEAKWGQTPGKMLLGIRVVQTNGRECTGFGAVVRNTTKLLGGSALLPILVAIALILSSDEKQRLGDVLGETTVVKA